MKLVSAGKTVETGIRTEEQDRRARRLQKQVRDLPDHPVAEDRPANLGQHRRIFGDKRSGVGGMHQVDDTNQQEPEDTGHSGEHPTRVGALRLTKDIDRVGDRLDPGQRGAAVGECAQQYKNRGAHNQPVALMDRHRPGNVRRIVLR